MIEPLRISFVVECPADHAYDTWIAAAWWPMSHTMSGADDLDVIFEARPGGRIFERAPDGTEIDFGEVVACERPRRIAYLWHMRAERSDATDVEITFTERDDGTTDVDIEHTGWERLGDRGQPWRDRNQAGWDGLLPHFIAACTS